MNFITISPIPPLPTLDKIRPLDSFNEHYSEGVTPRKGYEFTQYLTNAIKQVDALQKSADVASVQLATGRGEDLAQAMITMEKASLSLALLVTARDKAIESYNMIARMQL